MEFARVELLWLASRLKSAIRTRELLLSSFVPRARSEYSSVLYSHNPRRIRATRPLVSVQNCLHAHYHLHGIFTASVTASGGAAARVVRQYHCAIHAIAKFDVCAVVKPVARPDSDGPTATRTATRSNQ